MNVVYPFSVSLCFSSILIDKKKTMTKNTTVHKKYFEHGLE